MREDNTLFTLDLEYAFNMVYRRTTNAKCLMKVLSKYSDRRPRSARRLLCDADCLEKESHEELLAFAIAHKGISIVINESLIIDIVILISRKGKSCQIQCPGYVYNV